MATVLGTLETQNFFESTALAGALGAPSNRPDKLYFWQNQQDVTLDTAGTTNDLTAGFVPANSVVLAVLATVETAITTATGLQVGDSSTAARWGTLSAVTAGSTNEATAWTPWKGTISTDATGPTASATAPTIRLTATGGTPGAGVVRVTAWGWALRSGGSSE